MIFLEIIDEYNTGNRKMFVLDSQTHTNYNLPMMKVSPVGKGPDHYGTFRSLFDEDEQKLLDFYNSKKASSECVYIYNNNKWSPVRVGRATKQQVIDLKAGDQLIIYGGWYSHKFSIKDFIFPSNPFSSQGNSIYCYQVMQKGLEDYPKFVFNPKYFGD